MDHVQALYPGWGLVIEFCGYIAGDGVPIEWGEVGGEKKSGKKCQKRDRNQDQNQSDACSVKEVYQRRHTALLGANRYGLFSGSLKFTHNAIRKYTLFYMFHHSPRIDL